jgi:hypothetical protein
MKCFNHRNVDAIAICKNCNKGLCPACGVDVGNGIACKGGCELEVEMMNKVFQQSKRAFQNASKTYSQYALWMLLVAVGMFILALFLPIPEYLVFMGFLFLIGAAFNYFASKRYK